MILRTRLTTVYRLNQSIRQLSLHYVHASEDKPPYDSESARKTEADREIPIRLKPSQNTSFFKSSKYSGESGNQDTSFKFPNLPNHDSEDGAVPLYEHHIPTNSLQKTVLSVGAATAALLNPRRADMVAVLGETTGYPALSRLLSLMIKDPEGEKILLDKPRINSSVVDLKELSKLPEGTLGHAYIKFLDDNQVTPDSRLPVQFVDDAELAYIMQRYREAHDLFHTVLGMPTNMLGEVTVKWIEGIQTGLPMCIGGAIFGPLRFKPKQRQKYLSTYLPWALRVGKTSKLLMNVYFEKRWDQSLVDLRQELGIEEPPI